MSIIMNNISKESNNKKIFSFFIVIVIIHKQLELKIKKCLINNLLNFPDILSYMLEFQNEYLTICREMNLFL